MPLLQIFQRVESSSSTSSMEEMPDNKAQPSVVEKPFFIMDWLDEMAADQDAETLARLLRTPQKEPREKAYDYRDDDDDDTSTFDGYSEGSKSINSCPATPKSSNRASKGEPRRLFVSEKDRLCPPWQQEQQEAVNDERVARLHQSRRNRYKEESVVKRSLKMANGWNAKGLQKAGQDMWKDALACWDNALEIRLSLLGSQHNEVANSYNNRGIALGKLGRYNEALDSLNAALEIRIHLWNETTDAVTMLHQGGSASTITQALPGEGNAPVSILQNMANVHQQAGDLGKALGVLKDAQGCATGIYLARVCVAMGHVYQDAEQHLDALDAYRDAMQVYKQGLQQAPSAQEDEWTHRTEPLQHTRDAYLAEMADLEHYLQEHRLRGLFAEQL